MQAFLTLTYHQLGNEHDFACADNVRSNVIEEMLGLNVSPGTAQRVHLRITGVSLPPLIRRATLCRGLGLLLCHQPH